MMENSVRAGFVGFGEVNTPREFIDARCGEAAAELRRRGVALHEAAPVADDPAGREADRAAAELAAGDFDALVVCVAGWIPSWAVIRTIERFKHKPILLWGLSGWRQEAGFVTTADQAGTTALRLPLAEQGFHCRYLVNFKDGAPRYAEAVDFLRAASAAAALRGDLIGMCGYRDMRLYGTGYDANALKAAVGTEVEHFDLLEIAELMREVPEAEIARVAGELPEKWRFVREPRPGTVENSIRLALAFRRKILERGCKAFSFCDVDGVKRLLRFAPAGAMTLLHDLLDIVTVPEHDACGCVTGLLLRRLTGAPAAYLEFYEFTASSALMGVPDYVPGAFVDGKVAVMPNAFGGFGEGLLNVSKLKTGPVTIARLAWSGGRPLLHAALGEAGTPERWEEAGWAPPAPQLPSLEIAFRFPSDEFLEAVAGQHYLVSHGDCSNLLRDYCRIAGVDFKFHGVQHG